MSDYQMRGNRVAPINETAIALAASHVASLLKLSKRNKKKIDKSFEMLSRWGITVNVVPNHDWLGVTKGHFDPQTMTISVPEEIYENACEGERDALFVMLHELGHLFLSHKALFHESGKLPTRNEDAEWQADTFAEIILNSMGYKTAQLSFDFYM